jgi:hypothetical protein
MSDLTRIFDLEAAALRHALRAHPRLAPLFGPARDQDGPALRESYLRLLKLTVDYVAHTVPMLRAAGRALAGGDAGDRAWSALFLVYGADETEQYRGEERAHDAWALEDLRALDAPAPLLAEPPAAPVDWYGDYFVRRAAEHPYAVLGAKGVLEHLALALADDLVAAVRASSIPNGARATSFFARHGVLDVEHVRAGDRNLAALADPRKRAQVIEGAYVTGGSYRAFLAYALP